MSCSDILLSFLADAGEDWADSFIFPEVDSAELMPMEFLTKTRNFDSFEYLDCPDSPATTCSEASSSSCEDIDFDAALEIFEGISGDVPLDDASYADNFAFTFDDCEVVASKRHSTKGATAKPPSPAAAPSASSRKRKTFSASAPLPNTSKLSKEAMDGKVNNVVELLRKFKSQGTSFLTAEATASSPKKPRLAAAFDPIESAQQYLQLLLGANAATPADLLGLSTVNATLQSQSLASLVQQTQTRNARHHLSAWAPVKNASTLQFPQAHLGIGQVAAASRGFASAMRDLISPNFIQTLKFSVNIDPASVITSVEKLSASFTWRSEGMLSQGYPQEFEFTGLIRCSFTDDGISNTSLMFDACKLVRQTEAMFQLKTVSFPSLL